MKCHYFFYICFPVQKGYLFMLEHIHEELQLLDYLCQLCELPLRDDEKKDMIDGKGFFMKREIDPIF